MGFLSKAWKGVKKGFKSIGKGIKSAFKSFGKFMGKIGVVGQIAMMFILPGVGQALMSGIGNAFGAVVGQTAAQATAATAAATASAATATAGAAATAAVGTGTATAAQAAAIEAGKVASTELAKGVATKTLTKTVVDGVTTYAGKAGGMLGSSNAIISGAGKVLQAASNFVRVGANAFSTVTEGISSFIGEFGKTALNKIPGVTIEGAAGTFGGAWENVQANVMTNATKTMASFNKAIGYTPPPVAVTTVPVGGTTASSNPAGEIGTNSVAIDNTVKVDLSETAPIDTPESLVSKSTSGGRVPVGTGVVDPVAPTVSTDLQFGADVGPQQVAEEGFFSEFTQNLSEFPDRIRQSLLDSPKNFVEKLTELPERTGQAIANAPNQYINQQIAGKPEGTKVYSSQVQGMGAAFDMPQVGTSTEVQQRAQEMGYNPDAFQANNMWGAGAQNANYSKSMGFDRFAVQGGSI